MSVEEREEWACAQQGEACLAGRFYEESLAWADSFTASDDSTGPLRDMLAEAFREGLRSPWAWWMTTARSSGLGDTT